MITRYVARLFCCGERYDRLCFITWVRVIQTLVWVFIGGFGVRLCTVRGRQRVCVDVIEVLVSGAAVKAGRGGWTYCCPAIDTVPFL